MAHLFSYCWPKFGFHPSFRSQTTSNHDVEDEVVNIKELLTMKINRTPYQRSSKRWTHSQVAIWSLFLYALHFMSQDNESLVPHEHLFNLQSHRQTQNCPGSGSSSDSRGHQIVISSDGKRSERKGKKGGYDPSNFNAPYYLTGRTAWKPKDELYNGENYNEGKIFYSIEKSKVHEIPFSQNSWFLPKKLAKPTRNHDNIIFDVGSSGRQILLAMLGRHSGLLQWFDLVTGEQNKKQVTGVDPAGNPLDNLNHVYSVVVDSLSTPSHKEVWLPCGFHGHEVNQEQSSEYVRIVSLKTMAVEAGPKLPFAGGACVAAAIHVNGPNEPPHICTFGGTHGAHDTGTFLPYTSCYDRVAQKWHHPFGRLPFGFDHGSLVHIPPGVCDSSDPGRVLIFNFRTRNYGTQSPEILAFDLPSEGWPTDDVANMDPETPGDWYIYANISYTGTHDQVNAPRDASGVAIANDWRNIINFGGIHYHRHRNVTSWHGDTKTKRSRRRFSTIRSLDVCTKEWSKVGDLGLRTFALQTSVSEKLNVAVTCGGHTYKRQTENSPWCIVNRIPEMKLQATRGSKTTESRVPGLVFD